ncbi:MAG: hypothetical protein AAGN46_17040 [Acidobacteriota bacterium]
MNDPDTSLGELRDLLRESLQPIRTVPGPLLVTAGTALLVTCALAVFLSIKPLRFDRAALGAIGMWWLSIGQLVMAILLLAMAVRDTVPGFRPSRAQLGVGAGLAIAVHGGVTGLSWHRSPVALPETADALSIGFYCHRVELLAALPCVLLAALLASLGLSSRPLRLGFLLGAGSALAADSAWRLVCPISDPAHVIGAHSSALLSAGLVGLLCMAVVQALRRRI